MELISVIVPVYKVENYLNKCIESIVNQTYSNLEIILVDDGSPDNCPAMCDQWAAKDSRIRVIHKENGGLSDARNTGMEIASGSYICFVDSDDWIHPEYVERLYSACIEHQTSIAACDVQFVFDTSIIDYSLPSFKSTCCTTEQALNTLIHGTGFRAVAWNKLYRRDILKNESFPVGRFHEDEFFTYRILAKAPTLAYVDAQLYYYYQRSGSIMNSVSIRHLDVLDAGLERMTFLQQSFPKLYHSDKAGFCVACVSYYRFSSKIPETERSKYKKKIRECRSVVSFSFSELFAYSAKELVYVIGSGLCIDIFCKILNIRRK